MDNNLKELLTKSKEVFAVKRPKKILNHDCDGRCDSLEKVFKEIGSAPIDLSTIEKLLADPVDILSINIQGIQFLFSSIVQYEIEHNALGSILAPYFMVPSPYTEHNAYVLKVKETMQFSDLQKCVIRDYLKLIAMNNNDSRIKKSIELYWDHIK